MWTERQREEKTYEQYMEEALRKISLYCPEWTDRNPSDPGITILENMTAFHLLQSNYMENESDEMKLALYALSGFELRKGQQAEAYIEAENVSDTFILPENQQFMVGDLIFECEKATLVSRGRMTEVLVNGRTGSELLRRNNAYPIAVFSDKPQVNMTVEFFFDELPKEEGRLSFYVKCHDKYGRNPADEPLHMAKIRWQCYTKDGFTDISCTDETQCFLFDGLMTFSIEGITPEVYQHEQHRGYVIRGILEKNTYDIPPQILYVSGLLFQVKQQHTKSICREFCDTDEIWLYSDILENEYVRIFVWNQERNCYELCRQEDYEVCHEGFGMFHFMFGRSYEKILISAYSEEMMPLSNLGILYGYDEETVALPLENEMVTECTLILEKENRKGGTDYYHMIPDTENSGGFLCHMDYQKGEVSIEDCGEYQGCTVYLGKYVTAQGRKGNIPEGKRFLPAGYDTDIIFFNPVSGRGGRDYESLEELEKRYLSDVNESYTAVGQEDYNRIVLSTPGLCIHKVHSYMGTDGDCVHIAVKPYSDKRHPSLSKIYKQMIMNRLEDRRLMNTYIRLESPVYTAVNVYGRVNVKEHYTGTEQILYETIRDCLDYVNTDRGFGEKLRFDMVFEAVERLECVENISDFVIRPSGKSHVTMEGVDILPHGNCLLYPGEIRIDTHVVHRT